MSRTEMVKVLWRLTTRLARELLTTVHVIAVLAVVEAGVRWMSLPRFSRALGCPVDLTSPIHTSPTTDRLPTDRLPIHMVLPVAPGDLPRRERRQLRCTHRVADAWPLSHGPCLRRALVGGHLIRRLSPTIRLGTHDDGGVLVAHAWLEIDGRPLEDISGYTSFELALEGSRPVIARPE